MGEIDVPDKHHEEVAPPPPLPTVDELQCLIDDLRKATPGDEERRWEYTYSYQLRRVPERVRAINSDAYTPRFVCIGPYHRGDPGNPLRRERLKERYVLELLQEADDKGDLAKLIRHCTESLAKLEGMVRRFYAEENIGSDTSRMASGELVRMLLLDGCFIIKHLYNYARGVNEAELYQTRWAPAQLRIDLGLLENQVPYAVLEALFEHLAPRKLLPRRHCADSNPDRTRKRLVLQQMTLWYMMSGRQPPIDLRPPRIHHLLHLMHLAHLAMLKQALELRRLPAALVVRLRRALKGAVCGCPVRFMRLLLCRWVGCCGCPVRFMRLLLCRWDGCCGCPARFMMLLLCRWEGWHEHYDLVDANDNIASAVQLRSMGIKINKAAPATSGGMLDVRFRDDGVTLEIPPLTIEQATAPLLHNLIAFEQQATPQEHDQKELVDDEEEEGDDEEKQEKTGDYFTTYAFLMYNLVNTREDIALLQERGILQNNFGSDDQIINYFKNLCMWNQRSETKIPLGKVLRNLRKCSHDRSYRDWAEVKKYVNSPVKILLVILSAIVSASSILQAIFAFRSRG